MGVCGSSNKQTPSISTHSEGHKYEDTSKQLKVVTVGPVTGEKFTVRCCCPSVIHPNTMFVVGESTDTAGMLKIACVSDLNTNSLVVKITEHESLFRDSKGRRLQCKLQSSFSSHSDRDNRTCCAGCAAIDN